MPITDAYITYLVKETMNDTPGDAFDHDHAYLCIGDSDAAFAASQTNMQAVTNKVRIGMDTNFPARDGNKITFQATAGEEVANFAWLEWGVANHSSAGVLANRKPENKGTKSGGSWVFEASLTLALGVAPA
jgi:hypothetical protein